MPLIGIGADLIMDLVASSERSTPQDIDRINVFGMRKLDDDAVGMLESDAGVMATE